MSQIHTWLKDKFKNKKKYFSLILLLFFLSAQAALYQNCSKVKTISSEGSTDLGSNNPLPCTLPWGGTIESGQNILAYQALTVSSGQACVSQTRVCDNGNLSGTYNYDSCSVASIVYTYSWQTSSFGACSATVCGTQGTQTRSVVCKRNDGTTVSDSFCSSAKPSTSQVCSAPICVSTYTHFIRPDGGTSTQCTGKTNVPYPGSGTAQNCAWKSLTYALTMQQTPLIKSGDKIYIESGTYKIGYGQPGAEINPGQCNSDYTYDCEMSPIPSGVTIEGNCTNKPKLVGVERIGKILDLTNSSNVTLKCLEVTDNLECVEFHNTNNGLGIKRCVRDTYPHGEWASTGIYATDSGSVTLDQVNIHGLANTGIHAGRLSNWTIQYSNIDGNGWGGWNGDVGATTSSNSGTIKFLHSTIKWNGCVEMFNGTHQGCWAQQEGGYGDGLGTNATQGTWVFDGMSVEYNTSDGIDMLYLRSGANVTVKNSYIAHNAGNQVKVAENSLVENNVIIGDCSYHSRFASMNTGDLCRAQGNTLSVGISGGSTIKNNTITGEGDCMLLTTGTGSINVNGNIFDGRPDWIATNQGFPEQTCFQYQDGSGVLTKTVTSNLVYNAKEGCVAGQICQSPKFVNAAFATFDPHLQSGSPAIGLGADLSLVASP